MSSHNPLKPLALAFSLITALVSVSAQAAITPYQGAQGPKPDLTNPAPPALLPVITDKQALYAQNVAPAALGGNEFESVVGGNLNFTYGNGGSATFSGGATLQQGSIASPILGRYNTTTGLPADPVSGEPSAGNWIEASSTFSISFSQAISAFSFFVTDLGDFFGTFSLDLFSGANGDELLESIPLVNGAIGDQVIPAAGGGTVREMGTGNGNLLWVGITQSDPLKGITKATLRISQCVVGQTPGCDGLDVIGMDSIVINSYTGNGGGTIPEPSSLALAGLALLGLGAARARRNS
jgi:PEP-CTERM motif